MFTPHNTLNQLWYIEGLPGKEMVIQNLSLLKSQSVKSTESLSKMATYSFVVMSTLLAFLVTSTAAAPLDGNGEAENSALKINVKDL